MPNLQNGDNIVPAIIKAKHYGVLEKLLSQVWIDSDLIKAVDRIMDNRGIKNGSNYYLEGVSVGN